VPAIGSSRGDRVLDTLSVSATVTVTSRQTYRRGNECTPFVRIAPAHSKGSHACRLLWIIQLLRDHQIPVLLLICAIALANISPRSVCEPTSARRSQDASRRLLLGVKSLTVSLRNPMVLTANAKAITAASPCAPVGFFLRGPACSRQPSRAPVSSKRYRCDAALWGVGVFFCFFFFFRGDHSRPTSRDRVPPQAIGGRGVGRTIVAGWKSRRSGDLGSRDS